MTRPFTLATALEICPLHEIYACQGAHVKRIHADEQQKMETWASRQSHWRLLQLFGHCMNDVHAKAL